MIQKFILTIVSWFDQIISVPVLLSFYMNHQVKVNNKQLISFKLYFY